MEYHIEKKNENTLVVSLNGRLVGEYQTIQLAEQLEEDIEDGFANIIFDFSQLEFINSSGLNFLLKILTKVRRVDGEVVLCAMKDHLKTLMVTTKLNSFFTISDSVTDALGNFETEKV
jgi:anti-anti-sigma factor